MKVSSVHFLCRDLISDSQKPSNSYPLFEQAQWLKNNNLGGATIWPLDMDDVTDSVCKQGKFPLTRTLKKALNIQIPSKWQQHSIGVKPFTNQR